MDYKITEKDVDIVIDALHEYEFDNDFFIKKVRKALTKYDELKEAYIEERLKRYKLIVPNGIFDCPCDECKRRYFEDFEKQLRQRVNEEF